MRLDIHTNAVCYRFGYKKKCKITLTPNCDQRDLFESVTAWPSTLRLLTWEGAVSGGTRETAINGLIRIITDNHDSAESHTVI